MARGSENLENFKLRAVAAAAGQTFIDVGGRSRQAEAAGVDESLIASWWCATYFFARITAFFTGDAVGCQKTVMLFSRHRRDPRRVARRGRRRPAGRPDGGARGQSTEALGQARQAVFHGAWFFQTAPAVRGA